MSSENSGLPATASTTPQNPIKDTENKSILDIFDWSSVESVSDISR